MSGGGLLGIDTKNKTLRCPRDKTVMDETEKNSAFIDICGKCGGMFFDQGEMFGACGIKADPSYWDRPETGGQMRDSTIHCARCDGHMLIQDIRKGDAHVEIDRCNHCGGIWLDKGEIEKIIEIGEMMVPVVRAERDKAKAELDAMGDDPFATPGVIASFLALFGIGKKKK